MPRPLQSTPERRILPLPCIMSSVLSSVATSGESLSAAQTRELVAQACPAKDYKGKRVLLIVPDSTRTCPLGMLFKAIHEQIGPVTVALDVIIALGTHQPISEEAICRRLDIPLAERLATFARVRFFNHEWDNPAALRKVGDLTTKDTRDLTDGLLEMEVEVTVNQRLFEYDQIIIVGPVFPHEVVGFSGGNKYLIPGVGGPDVLHFFHWLGAVVTNPMIIGNKWTPVRKVVDRVGAMVPIPKLCFCMVVEKAELAGLFAGSPEAAWDQASEPRSGCTSRTRNGPFTPFFPARRKCTMSCGSAGSACTSWSRSWPTAASSSSMRRTSMKFRSHTGG